MSEQQHGTNPDQDAGPPGNGIDDRPGPHPDPPLDDDLNVTEENADHPAEEPPDQAEES